MLIIETLFFGERREDHSRKDNRFWVYYSYLQIPVAIAAPVTLQVDEVRRDDCYR